MSNAKDHPTAARSRAKPRGAWPLAGGFLLSICLHWAALRLYPAFPEAPPEDGPVRAARSPSALRAIEAVRIVEVEQPNPASQDEPVEVVAPAPAGEVPEAPSFDEDVRIRFEGQYRSAADRLRAGQGDPRLWTPVAPELVRPTPDEVLRMEILVAIRAMEDSAMSESEALRRAMDWTYTDSEGKKWGAQDGVIYLGGVPLPLPFTFGAAPDYNGDQADRAFRFREIDRAAGTRAVQLTWKERLKLMRLRREASRAAEPDTTGATLR